jgi:hypothetical protein
MAGTTRVAAAVGLGALVLLHELGRTYGATRAERRTPMPGDALVERPQTVATHAITIPAPPEQVWPWLAQLGWHRGGWYTPRWVDALLFPANAPSADLVLEEYQQVAVGDVIPDGPPEAQCGFVVREVRPGEALVLESTSHLPLSWRLRGLAGICWTWSFVLVPLPAAGVTSTRLVFRWRARTKPAWLTAGAHLVVLPADFVMSWSMLHGLRERALSGAVVQQE